MVHPASQHHGYGHIPLSAGPDSGLIPIPEGPALGERDSGAVPLEPRIVWVLPDRRPGNASQCLGVAEALGLPYQVHPLNYTWAVRLTNRLRGASFIGLAPDTRSRLAPPWPDILIAAGRRTAPVARAIKKLSGGKTFLVQMMHPGPGAEDFDLIVVPDHDGLPTAPNVMQVLGAPHHNNQQKMQTAALAWQDRLQSLPSPRVALLIGGAWGRRPITPLEALRLVTQVDRAVGHLGGSLMVTTSRRTPRDATQAIGQAVTVPSYVHCWRRDAENPYFAFLGSADAVVVTGDSVSMCCEATATGRPVLVLCPPGLARPRQAQFLQRLFAHGAGRPWESVEADTHAANSPLASWLASPPPQVLHNAAESVAAAIRSRLSAREISP